MSGPSRAGGGGEPTGTRHGEAVRTATAGDGDRIAVLAAELVSALGAQRGGARLVEAVPASVQSGEAIRALLDDPSARVLVGTLDEVVVGFAVCHRDTAGPSGRGLLDGCYVEEEARGVGVGHLLLQAALAWLATNGCREVDGVALPGDRAAKNFYESAGFKARLLTMNRSLGGPD
jgi:GNAT superfamily N-acetyltransferase